MLTEVEPDLQQPSRLSLDLIGRGIFRVATPRNINKNQSGTVFWWYLATRSPQLLLRLCAIHET